MPRTASLLLLLVASGCTPDNGITKVNAGPVATILSPEDGATALDGRTTSYRGSASDPDDDAAHLRARWLVDGNEVCADATPEADGTTTCDLTLTVGTYSVSLEVRDPDDAVAVDTRTLVVGETEPPVVTLVSPVVDGVYVSDVEVPLEGFVTDAEDAATDLVVDWSSSLDGPLSGWAPPDTDGHVLGATLLSVGEHVITLTATDADGKSAEADVTITVLAPNTAPSAPVVVIQPPDPSEGDALVCEVASPAIDAEGDPITYSFTWEKDGAPFTGATTTTWSGDSVPSGETLGGEVWTCYGTPDDGDLAGPAGTASVTIADLPDTLCPGGNCALRYNGVDSYVSVPDAPSLSGGGRSWTVEAWVWYDSVTSNCMTAVRKGTSGSATYEYWLHKNWSPGDSLFWGSWAGFTVQAFSAVAPGAWYHYAGVYDAAAAEARMYVNGVELSSGAAAAPVANSDELRIGIDWDFGCDTLGVIDEVRISSVARYSGGFVPSVTFSPDADTMALWHFDEYTGTVAADVSGNGNDGTIHNATWTTEHP